MENKLESYLQWNKALWNYYFPIGDEDQDPILYLDENLLKEIGTVSGFSCNDWGDDFLSKILIDNEDLVEFKKEWRPYILRNKRLKNHEDSRLLDVDCNSLKKVRNWETLVCFLMSGLNIKPDDKTPLYFAMLCAIIYLASSQGADHTKMKTLAKHYLGEGYRGKVGELVYDLMKKLHSDQPSFNYENKIVSFNKKEVVFTQRNMSRIKYHLLLKAKERQDFIDFLEVGNLQWNEGSYADYANYILLPALQRANKPQKYFDIVKFPESIPYVKNILLSDLNWGKDPSSSVLGNVRQIKDVKWRYEMELDYDGNPHFYISTDYDLPFGFRLNNNGFEKIDEISDYIAFDIQFDEIKTAIVEHNGFEYCLSNLSQNDNGDWGKEIFFQQVGDRYYHQVVTPLEGKHYVKFIKTGTGGIERLTDGWTQSQIGIKGYEAYKIDSYTTLTRRTRQTNNNFVDDRFELYGVGTWFGIHLEEGQHIYWYPDKVGSEGEEIDSLIQAPNGKTYYRLPSDNTRLIRGNLIVKDSNGSEILSEQIKDDFIWDGLQTKYGFNEWGETIEGGSIPHTNARPNALRLIRNSADEPLSQDSNMLIQILYDIADKNGCVTREKLKSALNFIMGFYGIAPTTENRRSLIYALRRLGYVVAYKDGRNYINQLVAPFLEKTNYSINTANNAYIVKGVYSQECLQDLLKNGQVKYKKPYTEESLKYNPEYICLPDLVLLQLNNTGYWKVVDHPVAYDFIEAMANMNDFEGHFRIRENGDNYIGARDFDVPCMIKDNGEEKLCLENIRGQIVLCETYRDRDCIYRPIPKQLSRVYCQNKKNQPIAFFRSYIENGNTRIDNNQLTILKGMGKPALFDMALCDLNLGIPDTNRYFVVDINIENLPIEKNSIYSLGNTYDTAYSVEEVNEGLVKIGSRKIENHLKSSAVYVYPFNTHYRMTLVDPKAHKLTLSLYWENEKMPEAFSLGTKVYGKRTNGQYFEIEGDDSVNSKLSKVINGIKFDYGNAYNGDLAFLNKDISKDTAINVIIIKKHQ